MRLPRQLHSKGGGAVQQADYQALAAAYLFSGVPAQQLPALAEFLRPVARQYPKGGLVLLAGDVQREIGVVAQGLLQADKHTPAGTSFVMARLGPGDVFGDVLSVGHVKSPVTITAVQDCRVLFLPHTSIIAPASSPPPGHSRLVQNLAGGISEKYFALDRRLDLLLLKSLRAKLCAYLLEQAAQAGAPTFSVPFGRAGMAAYLNCDRSALSRELSRMQGEGLLQVYQNSFKLLDLPALKSQARR